MLTHNAHSDIGDKGFGVTALHLAASANDDGIMEHILKDGRLNINVADSEGRTPLAVAAMKGAHNAAKALIERGALPDTDELLRKKESALLWALQGNHKAIARSLIEAGAKLDVVDIHGNSPLCIACNKPLRTFTNIVDDIVRKLPSTVNFRDALGRTPLHWASTQGDVEVVTALLDAGAPHDARTTDDEGVMPMHWAAGAGQVDVLETLILEGEKRGCPDWVNEIDAQRRTPLHWASVKSDKEGNQRCVKLLVRSGANVGLKDKAGRTAASLLAKNFDAETVAELLAPPAPSPW
jgi:ankyrin repeat protein